MITHNLIQGSPSWHAYRLAHDNASDAPAVMGCSSYKTREQLLAERATGIAPEVDAATQRRFDAGHRFEALARPLAEAIIGEDLYPCTGSLYGSRLSASFDGLTLLEDVALEHKTLNQRLRAVLEVPGCTGADLPMEYQIQMEQQCAVSDCDKILFMASAWDSEDQLIEELHCWYTPNPELRARILAGWEQFHKDLAAYVPPEPKPAPVVAEPMESLPAVSVRLDGKLAVVSNLPDFATALRAFIERIPAKPDTDQDFATAEAACKSLKRAEDALTAGEDAALGEMVDFEAMRRQVRDLKELARATRLATEKLVTARKEQIRGEIVAGGIAALREHIASLNTRLGKPYMPQVPADFGGVVKGKRTVDSLRGAVNDELARAKIAANEVADRIQINLNTLRELASAHAFLFADAATPTSGAAIQRYKIGYHSDEWGQRSSTPSGIPDASGSWVRYADHVTALAAGQATAAQAVVQDDLITIRKPTTSAEMLWLLKLAHLVISDVDKTLEKTFAPAQPAAQQGAAYAALPDERAAFEAWYIAQVRSKTSAANNWSDDEIHGAWLSRPREEYRSSFVEQSWEAWQARASRWQAPAGATLPDGWVPLTITHEGQYPEEVAYGPQIMMDRLGKWLGKYFAQAAQPDSVQEDAALWHWLAEYLVGTRTDLDDEIVASETVNDLRKLVEAAIKQGGA